MAPFCCGGGLVTRKKKSRRSKCHAVAPRALPQWGTVGLERAASTGFTPIAFMDLETLMVEATAAQALDLQDSGVERPHVCPALVHWEGPDPVRQPLDGGSQRTP